jgi:hypothetical protein
MTAKWPQSRQRPPCDLARQHRSATRAGAKTNLTDGIAPESRSEEDKQQLIRERDALMLAQADPATTQKAP